MITKEDHDWLKKQSTIKECENCYQEINPDLVPTDSKICISCIQILEKIKELEDDGPILFN
jgi:hypothetical protein